MCFRKSLSRLDQDPGGGVPHHPAPGFSSGEDWWGCVVGIDIDAGIAKARARAEARESVDQPVLFNDQKIEVRLTALSPDEWRDYSLQHPPRAGVVLDQNAGLNLDEAVREFQGVLLVDGDDTDDMMTVVDGEAVYRWPEVYGALSRNDRQNLAWALWSIHDAWYQEALKTAGKAQKGPRAS